MYKVIMMTLMCASLSAAYYDDKSAAGEHSKSMLPPVFRQAPPVPASPPTAKELESKKRDKALGDCKVQLHAETVFFKENLCNDSMSNCDSESYFSGVRLGIERFKKSSVYGRINWMVVPDQKHRDYNAYWYDETSTLHRKVKFKEKLALGHVDAELGYVFKIAGTDNCTLTPFIGTGRYHFMFKTRTFDPNMNDVNQPYKYYEDRYDRDDWPYVSAGIRADYSGEIFSIGLKYKQMRAYRVESIIPAGKETPRRIRQHPDFSSYEVSLPMSVRFGVASNWSASYEPYFVKFGSTNVPQMIGSRLSVDYRF